MPTGVFIGCGIQLVFVGAIDGPHMTLKAKTSGRKPHLRGRSTLKLYFKSDPAREHIDFHIILRDITTISGIGEMIGFSCHLLEQTNRGRLTLQTSDPADLPTIDPRMLEHPKDIHAMVSAMKFVERLAATEPLSQYCGELFSPAPDEDWARFARSTYTSYFHGVGTCKMGPMSDPMDRAGKNGGLGGGAPASRGRRGCCQ